MRLPAYAFPRQLPDVELHPDDVLQCINNHAGMTLRDYFAAKALASMVNAISTTPKFTDVCATESADCDLSIEDYVALRSYDWADAMLKARNA